MGFSKQEYWRFSCLVVSNSFVTPWTAVRQVPQSMGFPRQEYCSGLPFPPSGDLLDPGIEPLSPVYHWATREAEGREVQRANRKGLICLLSPLRTRVTERPLTESVETDMALARLPPRRHGKCRVWWKAMEGCARHEAMREEAKAVRSEKKGHVKDMPLRLLMVDSLHIPQVPLYEQRRKFHVAESRWWEGPMDTHTRSPDVTEVHMTQRSSAWCSGLFQWTGCGEDDRPGSQKDPGLNPSSTH